MQPWPVRSTPSALRQRFLSGLARGSQPSLPSWGALLILGTVAFFFFAHVLLRFSIIPDWDSYLHLAIARHYGEHGFQPVLPWARFSVLNSGLGDKELLFHGVLVPFATWMDPALGGRLVLALFNAGVVVSLGAFALRTLGRWGLAVPFLLYAGCGPFLDRIVRLRPELGSLLLLLLALWLVSRRSWVALGVVSGIYALSYTAIHFFLGLTCLWFLAEWFQIRVAPWRMLVAAFCGAACGVLCHPGFPANMRTFYYQAFLFFRHKAQLDVGPEILPPPWGPALAGSLGLLVGLSALLLAREEVAGATPNPSDRRLARSTWVAALTCLVLYAFMQRMAIYAFPFLTLALLAELRARGFRVAPVIRLGRLRLPLVAGLFTAAALCTLTLSRSVFVPMYRQGPADRTEATWAAIGRALPAGAKVAATWESAEVMAFWAPQGRYLNLFDPVFMAVPFPEAYAFHRQVFSGQEPDIPLAVAGPLDSDWIAYDLNKVPREVTERLVQDPRVTLMASGSTLLGRMNPTGQARFLLDWEVADSSPREIRPYPRLASPRLHRMEGFVDALRAGPGPRYAFTLPLPTRALDLELAPYGPTEVRIEDQLIFRTSQSRHAILGRGYRFSLPLGAKGRLVVITSKASDGRAGFYLVDRTSP